MVDVFEARDLEEDLASVDASVGDLVRGSESEAMVAKTWDFGQSLMTEEMIQDLEREGCFAASWAKLLPKGQTVPSPVEGFAVVFKDYFSCGLCLLTVPFLCQVFEAF